MPEDANGNLIPPGTPPGPPDQIFREPTSVLRARLDAERAKLEARLAAITKAERLLDRRPDLEQLIDALYAGGL